MAKKKTKKTNKTKRTTRASLDERNERLGKTDAPKPRKSRKPKSVVTNEPAINTVLRENRKNAWLKANANSLKNNFLAENDPSVVSQVVSKVVSWTPPAPEKYTQSEKELLESGWKHDLTTDDFVFHTDTKNTCCGGCNPNAPWWRKADMKMEQFKEWFGNKVEKAMHWAFDHPLAFTISLMSFFLGVAILVLLSSRK